MTFCPFCLVPSPGKCTQCGFKEEHAPTVSPQQLKQMLASSVSFTLVDVREEDEWATARLPGAKHIPLGQLPQRYIEIPQDKPIVAYCHHGIRANHAAAFLLQHNYTAQNLEGGIDRYSIEADSSIARYERHQLAGRAVVCKHEKRDDGIEVC
ncbi:hypothetical protein HY546_02075 [archaeon]|nr:hypothetical protein [archaeon]